MKNCANGLSASTLKYCSILGRGFILGMADLFYYLNDLTPPSQIYVKQADSYHNIFLTHYSFLR